MGKMHLILLSLVGVAAYMMTAAPPAAAMTHVVGGSHGWGIPPNKTFYQEWAKPRTFAVSDKLIFPYRRSLHNVLEVNKKDFEECTQQGQVSMHYQGPLVLQLNRTGEHFYYSGIGVQCEAGQKLSITVGNGKGSSGTPLPFHLQTVQKLSSGTAPTAAPSSAAAPLYHIGAIPAVAFFLSLFA